MNKYLNFEQLVKMEQELKIDSAKNYWKCMLLGFIVNIMEQANYQYKLTKQDIDNLVEDLLENETIYETIDFEISNLLVRFKK